MSVTMMAIIVFVSALITAAATGLGVLPFFFIKNISSKFFARSNAVAAGLMLSASFSLIFEGYEKNSIMTLAGMLVGLLAIIIMNKYIHSRADNNPARGNKSVLSGIIFLGVMTAHSFAEGISVGVSFADTLSFGVFISLAIAVHNIPEGLAIGLVMVPSGTSPGKAVWSSIASSLPQPIMAVPAFLLVNAFNRYLPFSLGLAAGAMIWLVFAELIHEANKAGSAKSTALWVTLSILVMNLFQVIIG